MDQIVTDQSILNQVSKECTYEEVEKLDLVGKLREAMKIAWTPGCGLAAIQIGIPLRFAWYIFKGKEGVLANPIITNKWGSETLKEGCLSIPNKWIPVDRAVTIEYISGYKKRKKRKVNGTLARIIQHEIDHMDGVLIIGKKYETT